MIKIQVPDAEAFKTEYLPIVHDTVVADLKLLKISLGHLNDPDSIDEDDIVSVKTITKEIVDSIRRPSTPNGTFNKPVYISAVRNYENGARSVHPINWANLIALVDHLLDEDNGSLEALLIGDPLAIKDSNDELLNQFHIHDPKELKILKHGFNYGGDAGPFVRQFFYGKDIYMYCSYCNFRRATHARNPDTGATAEQFQLDHFFSQTDHPLLALSLFNLVPSDSGCNMDNKGSVQFSDEMHLNPYVSGFKRDMVFRPVMDELGHNVTQIELKINVERDSERWKQLIGDHDTIHQHPEHGNLNIFEIYTIYNQPDVYFKTGKLLKSYVRVARNERSLHDILDEIVDGVNDAYENFKTWYEDTARTFFHEKEFGKLGCSKLYRDLLDYVYVNYPQDFHEEVRQIIQNSYLPEKGGE